MQNGTTLFFTNLFLFVDKKGTFWHVIKSKKIWPIKIQQKIKNDNSNYYKISFFFQLGYVFCQNKLEFMSNKFIYKIKVYF